MPAAVSPRYAVSSCYAINSRHAISARHAAVLAPVLCVLLLCDCYPAVFGMLFVLDVVWSLPLLCSPCSRACCCRMLAMLSVLPVLAMLPCDVFPLLAIFLDLNYAISARRADSTCCSFLPCCCAHHAGVLAICQCLPCSQCLLLSVLAMLSDLAMLLGLAMPLVLAMLSCSLL